MASDSLCLTLLLQTLGDQKTYSSIDHIYVALDFWNFWELLLFRFGSAGGCKMEVTR